jgi:hypothetical protein
VAVGVDVVHSSEFIVDLVDFLHARQS